MYLFLQNSTMSMGEKNQKVEIEPFSTHAANCRLLHIVQVTNMVVDLDCFVTVRVEILRGLTFLGVRPNCPGS
jgi:hypothetical protein